MKVLFLCNGLGLGNSTRCHAIMQRLYNQGAQIEVVTSGNGLWYFTDKHEVSAIHEVQSLAYGSKDGAISISRTFASLAGMFGVIRKNARILGTVLDQVRPDVVVTDSEYNFLPVKRRKVPLIALNNADVVWHSYFRFKDRPPSIRAQFFAVEMLDYRYHRLVPDLVLSPTLDPGIPKSGGNILRIGPIVREGYNPLPVQPNSPKSDPRRVAVMLSGSVFGTPVEFDRESYPMHIDVIGREKPDSSPPHPNVKFHGKIKDTNPLLQAADLTVVNGGFSAVSEMFWMHKPVIVVPVPRHAEQWINAQTMADLGLGLVATPETYEDIMFEAVDRITEFEAAYQQLPPAADGATQAAEAILNFNLKKIR
jgi:UDP:flavonoid glycosyltransferase YjiC (YdhE family)